MMAKLTPPSKYHPQNTSQTDLYPSQAMGGATTFASAKVKNAMGRIGIFFPIVLVYHGKSLLFQMSQSDFHRY